MKTYTLNSDKTYELQTCITCGCDFLISTILGEQLRKNRNTFHCPNGHSQSYTKSTADYLQDKLDAMTKELDIKQERINNLWQDLEQLKNQKRPAKRVA